MSPTIEIEDVTKRYRNEKAVDNITLHLNRGVTGVVGPNGAGKTTLLRIVATATTPTSGTLRLLSKNPEQPSQLAEIRSQLGYAPADVDISTHFTVLEFLHHIATLKGIEPGDQHEEIERVASTLNLDATLHQPLKQLSTGSIRRTLIAQALLGQPRLIVLDEPFSDLDPEERRSLRSTLVTQAQWSTILLAAHELTDTVAAADSIAIIGNGHLLFQGPPNEMSKHATPTTDQITPTESAYLNIIHNGLAERR